MESDFVSDSEVKAVLFVSREVRMENLKRKFYLRQESKRILLSCYYIFFKGVARDRGGHNYQGKTKGKEIQFICEGLGIF